MLILIIEKIELLNHIRFSKYCFIQKSGMFFIKKVSNENKILTIKFDNEIQLRGCILFYKDMKKSIIELNDDILKIYIYDRDNRYFLNINNKIEYEIAHTSVNIGN